MVKHMRVLSPAKINLHLRVGPVQRDGFHPLLSWMTTVGLFDTIEFFPDALFPGAAGRVVLSCDVPSIPTDTRNLIVQAAEALRAETGTGRGVRITLTKQIPAGGGLGGGSGNAATALIALNALWALQLPQNRLAQLAADLGSDVAFFLQAPSAICSGRGEVVQPIAPPAGLWAVLVLPDIAMRTPAVYRQFDAMPADRTGWDRAFDFETWRSLSCEALLEQLSNDLEAPAFALRPELGALRSAIEQRLGRPVRMSGSGSTLFTLFSEQDQADRAAGLVRDEFAVRAIGVPLAPQV